MDAGILVPSKADVPDFAGFLGLESRLQAALLEHPIRVGVIDHLVELPEIDAIRAHPSQAVLEIAHRALVVALAVLGHQEDLVTLARLGEGATHDLLGPTIVVVPSVVEEGHALVDGDMHHPHGLVLVLDRTDVPAPETHNRDLLVGAPQPASRQTVRAVLLGNCLLSRGR